MTSYPDLSKADDKDIAAARNIMEMAEKRGPPFTRVNPDSKRIEYLKVEHWKNEKFTQKRGHKSIGQS